MWRLLGLGAKDFEYAKTQVYIPMEITQIQFGVLALEDPDKQTDQLVLTYKRN